MNTIKNEKLTKENASLQLLLELSKAEKTETISLKEALKYFKDKE